ncbi:hypothetical protein E1B28_003387 [Marasmius oreades]|uniref:Uncharacterized protein n=1 Tax=Marasmius oreades TaxID=181124 RepID=A0A9P7RMC8_9AGAR|nr:uncharacterized protein E1B28_003387 [Marasmius oreades]KAG7085851.1 hypothetical protein E1B28_003387 [Marasmius oreades]
MYRIYKHKRAERYDLRDYNCFFYSWTILTIVARRLLDIESPYIAKDELMDRLQRKGHLPALAESIVDSAVHTLRDSVLAAVGVFREQEQRRGEAYQRRPDEYHRPSFSSRSHNCATLSHSAVTSEFRWR